MGPAIGAAPAGRHRARLRCPSPERAHFRLKAVVGRSVVAARREGCLIGLHAGLDVVPRFGNSNGRRRRCLVSDVISDCLGRTEKMT